MIGIALVTSATALAAASEASGASTQIQRLGRTILNARSVALGPAQVAEVAAAIATALGVAGTTVNLLAAVIYNCIAAIARGVGMHIDTRQGR